MKMWVLNLGGPVKVAKLNEEQAIEQGAQILGETIIFGIAALCLVADYVRSSRKEASKEAARVAHLFALEQGMTELGLIVEKQDAQIRQLTRVAIAVKPKNVQISEYQPQEVKLDFFKDLPSVTIDLEANPEGRKTLQDALKPLQELPVRSPSPPLPVISPNPPTAGGDTSSDDKKR